MTKQQIIREQLICPYCKHKILEVCKPAGIGAHLRGCAKKHGVKYDKEYYVKENFKNIKISKE